MDFNNGYWKPEEGKKNPTPNTQNLYVVTFFRPTYTSKVPTTPKDKAEKGDKQNKERIGMNDTSKTTEYRLLTQAFDVYLHRVHNGNSRHSVIKESERIVDRELDEIHYLGEDSGKYFLNLLGKSRKTKLTELAEKLAEMNRVFRLAPVNDAHKNNMELLIRDAREYFTALDSMVH